MAMGKLGRRGGFGSGGGLGKAGTNTLPPIVNTITAAGAGSIAAPAGRSTLVMEAWGAGGAGDGASGATGNGGDGGGYSLFSIAVTPGQTIFYTVGAGGIGTTTLGGNGGDSWVNPNANSKPVASGCVGGGGKGSTGGVGIGTIGTINWSGGSGGAAGSGVGGGGGGGAGSGGNGIGGTAATGGAGGTPDGGAGGNGGFTTATTGAQPGGGGGGLWSGTNPAGNGGPGKVRLTFLVAAPLFTQFMTLASGLTVGYFDTTGLTIGGGKMAYARQLSNGNLLYCCMRHPNVSKVGVAEVNPATRAEIFTFSDPGWSLGGAASFTGTRNATNQITASSVSGTIIVGGILSGTGIPGGTTITGFISGTNGGAGVYSTSVDTTASGAAVSVKEYGGPEIAWKYDNGNYLITTVDGFQGNLGAVLYEMRPNKTTAWTWNGSATTDGNQGINLVKPATINGTDYVLIFGCGLSAPPHERDGIEVIRRDNQATVFHLTLSPTNEVSSGAHRKVGATNYIFAVVWTGDVIAYLINFDTQTVARTFNLGDLVSAPGSGWDLEWTDDDTIHLACGFNGAIAVLTGMTNFIASGTSLSLAWKSAVFTKDVLSAATPTTCFTPVSDGFTALVCTRSAIAAPGRIFQTVYGPKAQV